MAHGSDKESEVVGRKIEDIKLPRGTHVIQATNRHGVRRLFNELGLRPSFIENLFHRRCKRVERLFRLTFRRLNH